ncbi:MAG: hypothetical protein HN368_03555 [Spirochaetales bacterium]|nr:hypothetical protein [Spirochaetales bacterium]
MKPIAFIVLILTIIVLPLSADSLWDPDSSGLLTSSGNAGIGDTVLIVLDSETSLSYNSSRIDSERISIDISGGEGGDLLSFLPSGASSGSQSLKGGESVSIKASFAVRIASIDENGQFVLQGGRTIVIQGKEESISLSGIADPALIADDRSIPFSSIVDARLTYTALLDTGAGIINSADIIQIEEPLAAASVEAAVGTAAEEPAPAVAEADTTIAETKVTTALSEEKREELMLIYLNRLIDLVFGQ